MPRAWLNCETSTFNVLLPLSSAKLNSTAFMSETTRSGWTKNANSIFFPHSFHIWQLVHYDYTCCPRSDWIAYPAREQATPRFNWDMYTSSIIPDNLIKLVNLEIDCRNFRGVLSSLVMQGHPDSSRWVMDTKSYIIWKIMTLSSLHIIILTKNCKPKFFVRSWYHILEVPYIVLLALGIYQLACLIIPITSFQRFTMA